MRDRLIRALAFSSAAFSFSSAHAASFQGLGDLPGGAFASRATAISDDGRVVVGAGNYSATGDLVFFGIGDSPMTEAFRWESSTGMVGLGSAVPGLFPSGFSAANSVSSDGSIVVGSSLEGGFIWNEADGLQASSFFSNVADVSADGEVFAANRNSPIVALRVDTNSVVDLGTLPGQFASLAKGISSDGAVIVGSTAFQQGRAYRWDATQGMIDLGDLPGHADSATASRASADGSVVVGWATSPADSTGHVPTEAFRWVAGEGMHGLSFLGGSDFSLARDVSGDGSVVVGEAEVDHVRVAFIWDAEHGMRRLDAVLASLGIDLKDWSLSSATGISANGSTIVGYGNGPNGMEAWIALIPEPGSAILVGLGLALLASSRGVSSRRSGGAVRP